MTGAFAHKLRPINAECWQAWLLGKQSNYPIELDAPETLNEALSQAVAHAGNTGDTLAIQYSHTGRGKHTLWLFAVKRSTKHGTWRPAYDGGRKVFVGNLEPKQLAEMALAAPFKPVEPFDAFRDDPVGRDLTLVEQQP